MWIIPDKLRTSVFAQDMEGLTLDSKERSHLCEQSLMWRSKPLRWQIWLKKSTKVHWMQHLFTLIYEPFRAKCFVTEWIASAAAIRASHLANAETEKAKMTPATSGQQLKGQLQLFDQDSVFLKTSKDILPSALKTSCSTWASWVSSVQSDCLRRKKLARHIKENGCLSWPTATARDWKGTYVTLVRKDGKKRGDMLPDAVNIAENGQQDQTKDSTNGKSQELWATPTQHGNHNRKGASKHSGDGIATQVQNWPTPREAMSRDTDHDRGKGNLGEKVQSKGMVLNPNWVEQLMGLPVGWTQIETESTGSECLGME